MPEAGIYKVLVVDDSVFFVNYLKHIISRWSQFKLLTAYTAEDSLSIVELKEPDIILLDISLPHMNGLEACRRIKDIYPSIPIIIMTAELDPAERFRAYQAGADDFITKPFNAEQIMAHIRHHLHLSFLDIK